MSEEESFIEPHIYNRYDIIEKLGKGAYGVVWKATDKSGGDIVALKKIFNAFQNATDSQRTYREVFLLKELENENIIRLHKIIRAENDEDLYLVFEYMDSDLHYAIRSGILEEDHKRYIIYQLLKALVFLHSANVVHRDLKPENLLLNTACQLKVADFGLARSVHETEGSAYPMTDYVATRWYRAPEIVLGSNVYTKAVDMWAVGCIIAEMYSAKPLFPGKSTIDQLTKIMEITGKPNEQEIEETSASSKPSQTLLNSINRLVFRSLDSVLAEVNEEALELIKHLLVFSPVNRFQIEDCIAHSYVGKFREEREEIRCTKSVRIPIDDNTRKSIETYKEELYKLSDVELVPSTRQAGERSGSEEVDVDDKPKHQNADDEGESKRKDKKGKDKKGKTKTTTAQEEEPRKDKGKDKHKAKKGKSKGDTKKHKSKEKK